jgi:uncharacterized protein (TIGR00106 family)
MLLEFSIVPVGKTSIRNDVAEALKIVDASGLPYQLTPTATIVEGDWQAVMDIVRQCHERVRQDNDYVITNIRIEDEAGAKNQLSRNVHSVEQVVGHGLHRETATRKIA